MPAWIAPVVAGGVSLINNLLGRKQQKSNVQDTLRANKELAEYQWNKDLDMWNIQNEYNKPINQRKRMEEAGLNSAFMLGGGLQNTASQSPKYSEVRQDVNIPPVKLPDSISLYQDITMKDAQIDMVRQNANLVRQKAQNEDIAGDILERDKTLKDMDVNFRTTMDDYNLSFKEKQLQKTDREIENLIEKKVLMKADKELKDQVLKNKKAEGYNIWLRNLYQESINDLVEDGIMPTDNMVVRQIAKRIEELKSFGGSIPERYNQWKRSRRPVGETIKKVHDKLKGR